MSARPQLVPIPGERRDRACRKLGEAAAEALAEGRVGAAHDLLRVVCSPGRAKRVLLALLGDELTAPRPGRREVGA